MPSLRGLQDLENSIAMLENASGYRSRLEAATDFVNVVDHPMAYFYNGLDRQDFDNALNVYSRSGKPELGFLTLGRQGEEDFQISTTDEPIIDESMVRNFKPLNDYAIGTGSVLNSSNWTIYMNDMYVLGGIANRQPFYLASPRNLLNLWTINEGRSTLFARELAGLFMAGYELQRLADGSEIIYPPSQRSISLNLQDYMDRLPVFIGSPQRLHPMSEQNLIRLVYRASTNSVIRIRALAEHMYMP